MKPKNKKTDGPSCACGKTDLYEDWKKLNEKTEEEVADDDTGDADQKRPENKE